MSYLYLSLMCLLCFGMGVVVGRGMFKSKGIVGTLMVVQSDSNNEQPYIFLSIEPGGLTKIYDANHGTAIVKVDVKEGF